MDTGTIISGRYRVADVLGRGSFGTTYAADDLNTGGRVAVKQLDLRRVDDWKAVELFEREARVLASLDHPQIPDYVEFIPVAERGSGYLVQELAPGRSLEARLAAGERFSESRVRDMATELLQILVYLAERLPPVVHRDIKPANVIVGDDGRCYLVDFGSVRDAVEANCGGSTVAGTYGYMAPEQLHGEANPSSDLFGLGMTLVHLVTGTPPTKLERKRLKVDFRSHVQLSAELATFIERLIEPVPEDRFANPRAALEGLGSSPAGPVPWSLPARSEDSSESPRPARRSSSHPARAAPRGLGAVPASGDLSGGALAASVARKAREAEELEQREKALALERREKVARRARPRVRLVDDSEGFVLTLEPVSLSLRFLIQSPILLILMVNPGFAIAGDFFLGPSWPFFADDIVARYVVWALCLSLISLVVALLRAPRLHLRIAGGHFAAWTRSSKRPMAIGQVDELRISVDETDERGYGGVTLNMGGVSKSFSRLSSKDLGVITEAVERQRDGM